MAGGQAPAFRLPSALQAKLTLGIDALSYRGNIVRQARLEAGLDKGVLTLRRLSALLPGGGDVALTGTVASERGLPVLDVGWTPMPTTCAPCWNGWGTRWTGCRPTGCVSSR